MNKGYIAITSVLIVAAVAIGIGVVLTLSSISEAQTSLTGLRREATLNLVDSCIEEAQYLINTQNSLPASITLPFGTCSVTTNSHSGANWTYTVSGTLNSHTKSIQVTTTRSNTMTPNIWKEI